MIAASIASVLVLVAPQVANAGYSWIFYQYGTGSVNRWYLSGPQPNIAGGFAGVTTTANVKVQTQNGNGGIYQSAIGYGQVSMTHATLASGWSSACEFYNSPIGSATFNCQWRWNY